MIPDASLQRWCVAECLKFSRLERLLLSNIIQA